MNSDNYRRFTKSPRLTDKQLTFLLPFSSQSFLLLLLIFIPHKTITSCIGNKTGNLFNTYYCQSASKFSHCTLPQSTLSLPEVGSNIFYNLDLTNTKFCHFHLSISHSPFFITPSNNIHFRCYSGIWHAQKFYLRPFISLLAGFVQAQIGNNFAVFIKQLTTRSE